MSEAVEVTDHDRIRFDEWKYRHDLYYKLFFRYTTAVSLCGAIPIFQARSICEYNINLSIVGFAAIFFSVLGLLHMVLEFCRVLEARVGLKVSTQEVHHKMEREHPFYWKIRNIPFNIFMWVFMTIYMAAVCFSIFHIEIVNCLRNP